MTIDFAPRVDVLPAAQRRLWAELSAVPGPFVLYGGTAIALHLGHRESVDFDFFGNETFDPDRLLAEISFLADAVVTQRAGSTLSVIVDRDGPVRVSFFGVPAIARLRPALVAPENGLRVASLLDLAGTKVSVVQKRSEAKDYIDITAILLTGRVGLPAAIAAGMAIYGAQFNPQITLKALTYFEDGDLHRLTGQQKDTLTRAVQAVDLDNLPVIGSATP